MESLRTWTDYSGFFGYSPETSPTEDQIQDWETVGLANWGYKSPELGYISGDDISPILVEVDTHPEFAGMARTPMIELSPEDFRYVQKVGFAYDGMLGLGDDGEVYSYDGSLGFFKKLFRKIKKKVKKVAKRIVGGLKKVVSKLPGGKMLLKIAGKIHKVAMKIVRPLAKFVGKYASKLAPIAALIPGYGPAIAAALHTAGKIGKMMTKFGVKVIGQKGKVRSLLASDPKHIKDMQRELASEARKLAAARSRG